MDLEPGHLHYVDEGDGRPLLMLHGNPTWSFLYRHLITGLSDEYRCVAPDYFGFGLSEKPVGWSYRPAEHAEIIDTLIQQLELTDLTLVAQDWGGPIGLDYVTRNPDNVHSIVLLNTFMWPIERTRMRLFATLMGSRAARVLIRRYNLFAKRAMKVAVGDDFTLSPDVHRHYTAPLATPADREASWVFPHELQGSREWLADLWARRERLEEIPLLLAWGLEDSGLGPLLERWQESFPHATTVEFPDVGHYVAEEAGPELVTRIKEFFDTATSPEQRTGD